MQLETNRLILREMTQEDFPALCLIMQDEKVMTPVYGCPFTKEEVQSWLSRHLARYAQLGFGLWAVVLKETGEMIGQCGITLQTWKETEVLEIGYLFASKFWHQGYATEAARACKTYAFRSLNANAVHSIIPNFNIASCRVAERNGMTLQDSDTKVFRGREMLFLLYSTFR